MKILYVTGEAAPFAASGGLGDVMGALPFAAADLLGEGHEVGVILPLYRKVSPAVREKLEPVADLSFNLSWRRTGCRVWGYLCKGVTYYFVENHYYFDRANLYGDFDDGERFAFFCRAVLEFILQTGRVPDILHANDWQAALTVIYAKTRHCMDPRLSRMKTVYTIHNIEYQGKYGMDAMGDVLDLPPEAKNAVEYDGCINLAKGAIVLCDRLNTVSPRYAEELCNPYFAYGLADILRENSGKMRGIINGIDRGAFNSAAEDLATPFTVRNLVSGKAGNKQALQSELGLPEEKDVPMIAMITRLTEGKGVDLVLRVLEELLAGQEPVQFVLLGTGDHCYEDAFADICSRYPQRARALICFDRALSKRIYAGADIFLMPSKTEPCGLSQMIACAYGTVPVVRDVGGLHDSITPCDEEGGIGFRFQNFNAHEMLYSIRRALALYGDRDTWRALSRAAMKADFSWENSARQYLAMYQD